MHKYTNAVIVKRVRNCTSVQQIQSRCQATQMLIQKRNSLVTIVASYSNAGLILGNISLFIRVKDHIHVNIVKKHFNGFQA